MASDTTSPIAHRPAGVFLVFFLSAIIAGGALLRFTRLDEPIGGYHAMNEAQYITIAHNFSHVSLLKPTGFKSEEDIKARALYVYAVYACFRIFGERPSVARGVSAAAGAASIVLIFLIASMIHDRTSGLLCAALLASSPIHTTLSRNAQPDAMCVSLILLCIWIFLKSEKSSRRFLLLAAAGLAWGAAVFTKNSALLVLPGIMVYELVSKRGPKAAFTRLAAFAAPAALVPAPFLVYQIIHNPRGLVSIYRDIVLARPDAAQGAYMLKEAFWALTPAVAAAAAAGLAILLFSNFRKYALVTSLSLIFLFQYFYQHVHSYYFLTAAPFLLLAAGLSMGRMRGRLITAAALVSLVSSMAFTLVCTAATKIDYSNFSSAAKIISGESSSGTVIASSLVYNNYGPVLSYLLPGYKLIEKEKSPADAATGRLDVGERRPFYLLDFASANQQVQAPFQTLVPHDFNGVCVDSWVFYMLPISPHSFIPNRFGALAIPSGVPPCLGFTPFARVASLLISRAPDGAYIYLERDSAGNAAFKIR